MEDPEYGRPDFQAPTNPNQAEPEEGDEEEGADGDGAFAGIQAEQTLDRQVLSQLIASGSEGMTSMDITSRFGLNGKVYGRRLRELCRRFGVTLATRTSGRMSMTHLTLPPAVADLHRPRVAPPPPAPGQAGAAAAVPLPAGHLQGQQEAAAAAAAGALVEEDVIDLTALNAAMQSVRGSALRICAVMWMWGGTGWSVDASVTRLLSRLPTGRQPQAPPFALPPPPLPVSHQRPGTTAHHRIACDRSATRAGRRRPLARARLPPPTSVASTSPAPC